MTNQTYTPDDLGSVVNAALYLANVKGASLSLRDVYRFPDTDTVESYPCESLGFSLVESLERQGATFTGTDLYLTAEVTGHEYHVPLPVGVCARKARAEILRVVERWARYTPDLC